VAIHGNKSQNARTKALADFKANKVRILVATDIAARGLDIDQLPHVVNFELPNIEEDYVHRIGRTGRAGRSGEAISLVAPDEEKLLKGIERMTKQKIVDGDLLGFDASKVEAERPEVREPQKPRQPRGAKPDGERHGGGRKDKGKDSGKEHSRAAKPQGGRAQQPRGSARGAAPAVPALPPDRAPDEFRDDEIDNFGNRVDYVSPNQNNKQQNRGRRPGAPAAASGPSASNGVGQGPRPAGKGPRSNSGSGAAGGGRRQGSGSGAATGQGRNGAGRARPPRDTRTTSLNRDELPRQEAAVKNPRDKQPVIVHKGSRLDRFPTPEQLDELANNSRPRTEKPALLTRNRDE
jgi:ATP-dependent RNA helicase RhlE